MANRLGGNIHYASTANCLDAKACGMHFVRVGTWGTTTELGETPTAVHARLAATGLQMLPMVNNYGVAWTSSAWETSAVTAAAFADMDMIEIANEPYGSWFWGTQSQSPATYGAMVARCVAAVNTATSGRVKCLMGAGNEGSTGLDYFNGTTYSQDTAGGGWIKDAETANPGLLASLGGIALHSYGLRPGEIGAARSVATTARCAALGRANMPQWWTEFGRKIAYDSTGAQSSVAMSANEVTFAIRDWLLTSDVVDAVAVYEQRDWVAYDPTDDNGWGLIDENGVRRLSWYAYQDLALLNPGGVAAPIPVILGSLLPSTTRYPSTILLPSGG